MRMVVDLPAPFAPSRPKMLPAGTSKDTESTATNEPKRFVRPRTLDRGRAHSPTARSSIAFGR